MKIIQTLWTHEKSLLVNDFGWLSPEYHLMSWALSVLLIKKHYKKINLYTDANGYDFLIDRLGLPYSNVELTYDNVDSSNQFLWAVPKLLSYSSQKEHFIHVDGDVFLWKKLPSNITNADLVAQNFEISSDYNKNVIAGYFNNLNHTPQFIADNITTNNLPSYNAGIIGGKNIAFFKEYTSLALKLAKENKHIESVGFNILFEQILFGIMADRLSYKVSTLYDTPIQDNAYKSETICNFNQPSNRYTYMHVIGGLKKKKSVCEAMARALFYISAEHYTKILKLFSSNKFYYKTSISPIKNIYAEKTFDHKSNRTKKLAHSSPIAVAHANTRSELCDNIDKSENENLNLTFDFEQWQAKQKKTLWKKLPINYLDEMLHKYSAGLQTIKNIKQIQRCTFKTNKYLCMYKKSSTWPPETFEYVMHDNNNYTSDARIACVPALNLNGINILMVDQLDINLLIILKLEKSFKVLIKECYRLFGSTNKTEKRMITQLVTLRLQNLFYNHAIALEQQAAI